MSYLIDTNIFLRVLIREDETSFQSGLQLLEEIKLKKWDAFVPGIVLSEIAWTLKSYYGFSKSEIVSALRSIQNLRGLTLIDNYNYQLALDLYHHHAVKYIDACIASLPLIQEDGATLISYDRDFDKMGIDRKEPIHILG